MPTLDYPYHFDGGGRSAGTDEVDHIRDLIEQVLFTSPGERVMRPDFGAGLLALVFEPNSSTLAATTQFLVQSGLQRHLSALIAVDAVSVENIDSALQVTVRYTVLADGSAQQAAFAVPGGGA
jgi:phage baseplate assembly protein W